MVATRSEPQTIETDVLVSGGGPCGLMLAIELGRCGVRCLVVDAKPGTAFNPLANATQARTMEHFRRLAFAQSSRTNAVVVADSRPGDGGIGWHLATYVGRPCAVRADRDELVTTGARINAMRQAVLRERVRRLAHDLTAGAEHREEA